MTLQIRVPYEEYVIEITARVERTGGFTPHLCIINAMNSHRDDILFHSEELFLTATEALDAGLELGKQKIDEGL